MLKPTRRQLFLGILLVLSVLAVFRMDSKVTDSAWDTKTGSVTRNEPKRLNPQKQQELLQRQIVASSCWEPLPAPILGTNDGSRILNMGLPKCGSSSLHHLFWNSGFDSRHFICGKAGYCGVCMKNQVIQYRNRTGSSANDRSNMTTVSPPRLLSDCGNFTVFAQMDTVSMRPRGCVFPQIHYLDELYQEAPHATWVLPFRNVSDWIRSMTNWDARGKASPLRSRLKQLCSFPELNMTTKIRTDQDFETLFCRHVQHLRAFVQEHPTLSLVEFHLEDPLAGEFLARSIDGVNATAWGHDNIS